MSMTYIDGYTPTLSFKQSETHKQEALKARNWVDLNHISLFSALIQYKRTDIYTDFVTENF